jgi:hypothetical protein
VRSTGYISFIIKQINDHYADEKVMRQVEHAEIFANRPSGPSPVRDGLSDNSRYMVVSISFYSHL